ncbi:MAG: hypothetical protein Q9222_006902 [Ikaeria aurantiellina]
MPGLKRKLAEPAAISSTKTVKKPKLQTPSTKPLSEEFVFNSSSDEEAGQQKSIVKKPNVPIKNPTQPKAIVQKLKPAPPAKSTRPQPESSKKGQHESPSISSRESSTSRSQSGISSGEAVSPSEAEHPEADSESTSGSEASDDEEEDGDDEKLIVEAEIPRSPLIEPPTPYKPPPGFEAAVIASTSLSSQQQDIFARANLEGKQIWHIMAPATVPIASIKEVPIKEFEAGESILSYKENDYGFLTESDASFDSKVLLLPFTEQNAYRSAGTGISKTLHVRQVVELPLQIPKSKFPVTGDTQVSSTHVQEVRRQPQGLRMRYRPFGDTSSSDESGSSPQFKMPPIRSAAHTTKAQRDQKRPSHLTPPDNMPNGSKPGSQFKSAGFSETNGMSSQAHDPLLYHASPDTAERSAKDKEDKKKRKKSRTKDSLPQTQQSKHHVEKNQHKDADETPSKPKQTIKTSAEDTKHSDVRKSKDPSDEKMKRKAERKRRRELEDGGGKDAIDVLKDSFPESPRKGAESTTKPNDIILETTSNPAEPTKVKSKRRKRKSEATEP